jgi:hypothetical protein
MKYVQMCIDAHTMNVQTDIIKLIEKSNKEYLQQFIQYAEGNGLCLKELFKTFTAPSVITTKVQCNHMFKRGPNGGNRCGVIVKGDGIYCSKHKKQIQDDEPALKTDLENILEEEEEDDDVVVEDVDDDEEWESNSDDGY